MKRFLWRSAFGWLVTLNKVVHADRLLEWADYCADRADMDWIPGGAR